MKHCPVKGQICDKNCAFFDDYTQLCVYIGSTRALIDLAKTLEKFRHEGIWAYPRP